jgi:hypothetical protein
MCRYFPSLGHACPAAMIRPSAKLSPPSWAASPGRAPALGREDLFPVADVRLGSTNAFSRRPLSVASCPFTVDLEGQ